MNFQNMPYGKDLLLAMYNTPSRELNADAIAAILQEKLADQLGEMVLTKVHVSALYEKIGLQLKNRKKVAEKEPEPPKPSLMDILLTGIKLEQPGEVAEETEVSHPDEFQEKYSEPVDTNALKVLGEYNAYKEQEEKSNSNFDSHVNSAVAIFTENEFEAQLG